MALAFIAVIAAVSEATLFAWPHPDMLVFVVNNVLIYTPTEIVKKDRD